MTAQYANLDARHWVNEDFVNAVRDLYPATTKKIPLGYSTYTGWTGKDEVLFVTHEPLDDKAHFEGQLYEASFDDVGRQNFKAKILDQVKFSAPAKGKAASHERDRKRPGLDQKWGRTLQDRIKHAGLEKDARRGGGLYGYPKPIVSSCETAAKRLNRRAAGLMHTAIKRDKHILSFLEMHAGRGGSHAARVLLGAYKSSMPQTTWGDENPEFDFGVVASTKEAGRMYGMYGFPSKTAKMGLSACTAVREAAGVIGAEMHRRKAAQHGRITGFFGEHAKTAKCTACDLILSCYPAVDFKFRRASGEEPKTVADWLNWDPELG
jgi:hypothetical protein